MDLSAVDKSELSPLLLFVTLTEYLEIIPFCLSDWGGLQLTVTEVED